MHRLTKEEIEETHGTIRQWEDPKEFSRRIKD